MFLLRRFVLHYFTFLDLFPVGHMVVFTWRVLIKQRKVKQNCSFQGLKYSTPKRSIQTTREMMALYVQFNNIQAPSQLRGSMRLFSLIYFLHMQSDIISSTLQWFLLIYFSTMASKPSH